MPSPEVNPHAGRPPEPGMLVDIDRLVAAYHDDRPDPSVASQRVSFGTSGHRGTPLTRSFNEAHIVAAAAAVARYRKSQGIDGPLFVGRDTHAVSEPAFRTTLEVLGAAGVRVFVDDRDGYTPTPTVSHAILRYNEERGGSGASGTSGTGGGIGTGGTSGTGASGGTSMSANRGLADGIVITPSHNPPEDGGFKYDPPTGGPADADVTRWIQDEANRILERSIDSIRRVPFDRARREATGYDYLGTYVGDLESVVDMAAIRDSGLHIGVDPLGGASVAYWPSIAERYGLDLTVVNDAVDPTFRFMTVDWDGRIRMDPSSPHAMVRLVELRDRFDVAFGADTDADRFGVVTPSAGLLNPNHFLSAAIAYLFGGARSWGSSVAVGKTVVSSAMIDRVVADLGRRLWEVPVGFKWFVPGLVDGSVGFGGEESAGASFLRRDGTTWTTDKDGIIACLLAAEMTAKSGRDPGVAYRELTERFGAPAYRRIDAPATPEQKAALAALSPDAITATELAGDRVTDVLTRAPGNGAPIGGLKVVTEGGWFAARPSGTEDVYKVYAESWRSEEHLGRLLEEAQSLVGRVVRKAG